MTPTSIVWLVLALLALSGTCLAVGAWIGLSVGYNRGRAAAQDESRKVLRISGKA